MTKECGCGFGCVDVRSPLIKGAADSVELFLENVFPVPSCSLIRPENCSMRQRYSISLLLKATDSLALVNI